MFKKMLTILAITSFSFQANAISLETVVCETNPLTNTSSVSLVVNNTELTMHKIYVNAGSSGYPITTETGFAIPLIGRQTIGFDFSNIGPIETLVIYTLDLQINITARGCYTANY